MLASGIIATAIIGFIVANVMGFITLPLPGIGPSPEQKPLSINRIEVVEATSTTFPFQGIEVPAFKVWLTAKEWPVKLELYYMNDTLMGGPNPLKGKVLDSVLVNSSSEVPVLLFPSASWDYITYAGINVLPGYYVVMAYHEELTASKGITIKGPDLRIKSVELGIGYGPGPGYVAWWVDNITITIENTGDCLAYIGGIQLKIRELGETAPFTAGIMVHPGESVTFTAVSGGLYVEIRTPGTYHAEVIIDLGFRTWSYKGVTFTTPTPQLNVRRVVFKMEYDEFWDEWYLKKIYFIVNNTGSVPAYVFSIEVEIQGIGTDKYYYYPEEVVKPDETVLIFVDVWFVIEEPGTYTVIFTVDIGYTTIRYETTLTVS